MAYTEQATPIKPATIQGVIRDFDQLLQRAFKIAHSLEVTGDRLEGSRPQEAGEGQPDTPPHSLLDELQRKYRDLNRALGMCETGVLRIDNSLGYGDQKPSTSRLG